jgi:dipeptidase D
MIKLTAEALLFLTDKKSPHAVHKDFWHHLFKCFSIPRPSTDYGDANIPSRLDDIRNYIDGYAKENGWKSSIDKAGNIVVRSGKPEDKPLVVFQGHLDMVCSSNQPFDFDKNPIEVKITEDLQYVKSSQETTLGADNAVAIAGALAVMKANQDVSLEAIFTVDEETSFKGAINLDGTEIQAPFLLNLDSEEDGRICIGSAGGFEKDLFLNVPSLKINGGTEIFRQVEIKISNLPGGHSGIDIKKNRPNAIKCLAEILLSLKQEFFVLSIDGGSAPNVIPREAAAVIVTSDVHGVIDQLEKNVSLPEGAKLTFNSPSITETPKDMTVAETHEILLFVRAATHGSIIGLPDSSVNFASIKTSNKEDGSLSFTLHFFPRSSNEAALDSFDATLDAFASDYKATSSKQIGRFRAWQPKYDSQFTNLVAAECPSTSDPEKYLVHAGLECGELLPNLPTVTDCCSIGPTILDAHSPDERLDIDSAIRFVNWTQAVVQKLKKQ